VTPRPGIRTLAAATFIALLLAVIPAASAATEKIEPTPAEVNRAMGIPLFGSGSLWEENDAMVANRLRWPQESKTTYEAGYRRYPYTFNSDTRVFGVRALCLFLQGVGDKTSRVSILFANKGDIAFYMSPEEASRQKPDEPLNVSDGMMRGLQEAIRTEAATLRAGLRNLFGASRSVSLGRFQQTREQAERWDWQGHSFLLVELPGEYVALRILPTAVLDDADSSKKAFAAAKRDLPRRVEKRPNGDVLISDLPMSDQGRKGYCVPATFERLLRYYGLPADMNVLAMAGKTKAGGGTSISQIIGATQSVVYDAGGTIMPRNFSGNIQEIKPLIDAGKPLIFAHYSTKEFNKRVDGRMERRIAITNWNDWTTKFLPALKKGAPLKPEPEYGHVCLIIGYNEKTREIAITDSWGPAATERWMTEEEARQIMQPTGLSVIE
jgi:Peptidase_C39 like family